MEGPVLVCHPAGVSTWIPRDNIQTVKELKERAVKDLPWSPGQSTENLRVTLGGKTLEESTPLSECEFLPDSAIHLVLRVHGG